MKLYKCLREFHCSGFCPRIGKFYLGFKSDRASRVIKIYEKLPPNNCDLFYSEHFEEIITIFNRL